MTRVRVNVSVDAIGTATEGVAMLAAAAAGLDIAGRTDIAAHIYRDVAKLMPLLEAVATSAGPRAAMNLGMARDRLAQAATRKGTPQ